MRRRFFYISSFLFLLHFVLLTLNKLYPNRISNFYVYPFFQQNWELFAPPPDQNYRLYVVFESGRATELVGKLKSKHQTNLLAGNEAALLALTNSIHFFEKNQAPMTVSLKNASEDHNFMILNKTVQAFLENEEKQEDLKKIILLVQPVDPLQKRKIYYN